MAKVNRQNVITLTLRLSPQRESLQKRFDDGLSLTQYAQELAVPATTIAGILKGIGVNYKSRADARREEPKAQIERLTGVVVIQAQQIAILRTVIHRLAGEMNFSAPELVNFPEVVK